ncbi:AAA family ATPase [Cellulomonas fengjieae]|uniref:AAA family ATPase n=1 Tax=Cellulomonas fengjieae TaxID=2819978 RepID=A0ABS3SH39_9CELL|nr:AAA family ATPase [Cellulomonas fengjieae]MBO3085065.1 AAA family ATPase [Cellulomonas fengjieae]MBO3100812.1 AAA family ATPase [Cellulomonas fengjieae]QVI66348.1 AAA family ATPase [Cellulomonas fengjieae]
MSTSAGPGRTWPLVGRAAELDDLDDLLSTAADGVGVTVLLEGEAGVGKSSLVEALRGSARLLAVELRTAHASALRAAPFALLSDALLVRPSGVGRGPERAVGRGQVEAELADLLDAIAADPASSVARHDRAAELFAALLRRHGDTHPWVLVLEDVHEADAPSLEVLLRLAHEGAVPRALVVLTMRPVPYRPELAALVAAWTRAGARYLELRPLTARATVELAESLAGGPVGPSLRGTLATAGGNPRLIADVVRTARSAGALVTADGVLDPAGAQWLEPLDEVVRERVAYLGPEVLALLGQASVLGTSFVIADLAAMAGDPVADCWRTLRHGLAAGVVRARGDRLVFGHDLVRGALYNGLEPDHRRALHARAAWALRRAGAPSRVVMGHLERAR